MPGHSDREVEQVTPELLRNWPLPRPSGSKAGRGDVLVIGGSRFNPGGVLLAGLAALRIGAGRLTLALPESVALLAAVTTPEAGVRGWAEDMSGLAADLRQDLERAGVVLIGPGLDDAEVTRNLLAAVLPEVGPDQPVLLDAFALGVLSDLGRLADPLRGRLVLTPNRSEALRLAGLDADSDEEPDPGELIPTVAERYGAVVTGLGQIADPGGRRWRITTGQSGLATSGSGDVLAGAVAGLIARGADLEQAACWATHLHATAGERLSTRVGAVGFLARELVDQLPAALSELGG